MFSRSPPSPGEMTWVATWQNRQNQQSDCVPSEDSDQPRHPPSMIRVFAVRMKKPWVLSYPLSTQRRLWSDWENAQADLSLRWAHSHFVGFVMSRLTWFFLASITDAETLLIHAMNHTSLSLPLDSCIYLIDLKFTDRQASVSSVEPDQTAPFRLHLLDALFHGKILG